jgi:hypothetical protein
MRHVSHRPVIGWLAVLTWVTKSYNERQDDHQLCPEVDGHNLDKINVSACLRVDMAICTSCHLDSSLELAQ